MSFKCAFPRLFRIAKPRIVIVNPEYTVAGCRLRWGSILEINDIKQKNTIELVDLGDWCGDSWLPSKVVQAVSTFPRLKSIYQKIRLRLRLLRLAKANLAIFGKPYGAHHMEAMKSLKRHHTKILSDFCDFHSELNDAFLEAARYSDVITVPTPALASRIYLETSKETTIIPDKVDYCILPSNSALDKLADNMHPATILWYGLAFANNEPTYSFRIFCRVIACSEDIISNRALSVEIVSESPNRAKDYLTNQLSANSLAEVCSGQWSFDSMRQALLSPGFVILPYPEPVDSCEKSANRIELALCSGKVVISNGSNLSSLEHSLSTHVKPLPMISLDLSDLRFDGPRQYQQAFETRRILGERFSQINHLWSAAINRVLT
jgi:hypothetical protein